MCVCSGRSRHVMAVVVAEVGFSWAWFTLLHHAREYLVTVLHVPDHQVSTSLIFTILLNISSLGSHLSIVVLVVAAQSSQQANER